MADEVQAARLSKEDLLAQLRRERIPNKLLLQNQTFEGVLGDLASDITVFPAHVIRPITDQGAVIKRDDLKQPQPISGIVEDAQLFAYHKVSFPNLTIQAPWSNVKFKNITGFGVADTPEMLLGEDFCRAVGFDFAKYLQAQGQRLHNMDLSQDTTHAPMPEFAPGTVWRLSTMSGHEPMQAERYKYILQLCDPHDPVVDEDPLELSAPNIDISPVDPEYEKYILDGMIARFHAAIQDSGRILTLVTESLPGQKWNLSNF